MEHLTGDSLTAPDITTSMTTLGVTNMVFACLDDYSSDTTQMGSTVDPYPAGVASLATTGVGELERLRYVIKAATGWSQWYAHSDSWNRALGTITTDKQILGGSATWNAAGVTFTALKIGVTDTASAAGSLLLDLQVGGSSKWSVNKSGVLSHPNADTSKLKTVDESLSASTVLQDDDALQITLESGAHYLFDFFISFSSPAAADIKVAVVAPGAPSGFGWTNTSGNASQASGASLHYEWSGSDTGGYGRGFVRGAAAGTLKIQWAQSVSDAGTTTVRAGSWLRVQKVTN